MMSLLEEIFFNTSVQELILRMVFLLFFEKKLLYLFVMWREVVLVMMLTIYDFTRV